MMASINGSVGKGGRNSAADVRIVQELINKNIGKIVPLALLTVDGKVGSKTIGAIKEFQRRVVKMRLPDGRVDPGGKTIGHLNGTGPARPAPAPSNRTAVFENTTKSGQANQMTSGQITINHRSYSFRSGGHGRGNLPKGQYNVTPHLWERDNKSMNVGGVGYSFALSDKYDNRVKDTRTLLRIHPDGGVVGTNGCIGIVGDASVQRAFREDMRSEFRRTTDNSFVLTVR